MTILGLLVGSFLNVVIYRLPVMMEHEWRRQCQMLFGQLEEKREDSHEYYGLISPRSRCPACQKTIHAMDNIPVISYLFLRGRCRHCQGVISLRYPAIELASAILTGVLAAHFGYQAETFLAAVLTWSLLCLSMIDIDHQLLPDDITLPLLWLGLACGLFNLFTNVYSSVLGAMLGYGVLWVIFMLFRLVTGKEGMGYGDFKLLAMLGAWLGWEMLPLMILLASLLGAVVGITLIFMGRQDRKNPLPFGPYLALSGWVALLWGNEITHIYLKLV